MGAVAEGVTKSGRVRGEGLDVIDLESEVGEIGADLDGAALVKLANLDQLLAAGSLEENQLGTASAGQAADLLKAEHVFVEVDGFLKIGHAITRVEEFFDHWRDYRHNHEHVES